MTQPRQPSIPRRLLIATLLAWAAVVTVDRLVWLHAGEGMSLAVYNEAAAATRVCPNNSLVELKPHGTGANRSVSFRCYATVNTLKLWPGYTTGESAALVALVDSKGHPGAP